MGNYDKTKSLVEMQGVFSKVNKLLNDNKIQCYAIYNNNIPFGYITGQYFNKRNGIMISDCVVDSMVSNHEEHIYNLINYAYERMNDNCKYFRYFPEFEMSKNVYNKLKLNGFEVELRYSMEYDCLIPFNSEKLHKEYEFDYNLKKHYNRYFDIERDSFKGTIDELLFPELNEIEYRKSSDVIDETLSPMITYENNIIATSLINKIDSDVAEIESISVLKSHQNNGVGKILLKEILNNCYCKGFKKVILTVTKKNVSAIKLYFKMDFKVVEEFYVVTKEYF